MDDLSFLVELGLLTEDQRPLPLKNPCKIVKNGVIFQPFCQNGLSYDIAISWLQKAIRRGRLQEALYCAYHIGSLGPIFQSHLLNRLLVITSEDIGIAEVGLIPKIAEMYRSVFKPRPEFDTFFKVVTEMIILLTGAHKSRMADLLIYQAQKGAPEAEDDDAEIEVDDAEIEVDDAETDESEIELEDAEELEQFPESIEGAVHWAVQISRKKIHMPVVFQYQDSQKRVNFVQKGLAIFQMWQLLLCVDFLPEKLQEDIIELYKLYELRGSKDGLIFLVHALLIAYYEPDPASSLTSNSASTSASSQALSDLSAEEISIEEIKKYNPPVLNSAVDVHTRYGKKYLGRTLLDFFQHGSKLNNWKPVSNEKEILSRIISNLEGNSQVDSPREYQQPLIDKSIECLQQNKTGWLVMACGSGKTKTSYWIMRGFLEQESYLVVVVLPLLEILKQFFLSWSALNRQYQNKCLSAIIASGHYNFPKCDYTNYIHVQMDEIGKFLKFSADRKFIFTTYSGVPKIGAKLMEYGIVPSLVVYDEAHHLNERVMLEGHKLFLTATPPSSFLNYGNLIGTYDFREAISNKALTDYQIHVFHGARMDQIHPQDIISIILDICSKVIVYSSTTETARSLYENCQSESSSGKNVTLYYLDCRTPQAERKNIYSGFVADNKSIIFNCSILGEGVDLPQCDGVYIQSGYTTERRVVQAVGRPLRRSPNKSLSHIFLNKDKGYGKRIRALSRFDSLSAQKIKFITV